MPFKVNNAEASDFSNELYESGAMGQMTTFVLLWRNKQFIIFCMKFV